MLRLRRSIASSPTVLRVSVLVILIAIWQFMGNDQIRVALPTFTRTMAAVVDIITDGSLVKGLIETNIALVIGFALALAVSIPFGIAMGSVGVVERIAQPYLAILLAVPMIAMAPVVQIAFGLTLTARVAIVFLFAFVYISVNVMSGVQVVDASLKEMARSFGASRSQLLRRVVLPSAVPAIMAGVRLGLGRAIIGMIVAELYLVASGIGSMLVVFQVRFEPAYVLAVVLAVVAEGVLLMEITARLEERLTRWRGSPANA